MKSTNKTLAFGFVVLRDPNDELVEHHFGVNVQVELGLSDQRCLDD